MSVSWSDHRHLLVVEDSRVFLLAMDSIRSILDRLPMTLVCVSGNEWPVYRGSLTVEGPLE
jgi:DNA transposition AAA+ family ATPase